MENAKENSLTLLKLENYKQTFDVSIKIISHTYINIISEFLLHIAENIIIQNKQYYIFIVKRGLDTIKHIFNILLLYTKNLDLTIHHTKKAFLFYVEFIGQIGQDNHSYLQLNSKDAILFVYKKTIFDINQDVKKQFVYDKKNKTNVFINLFTQIHNDFCLYLIENMNVEDNKVIDYFMYVQVMIKRITEKIIKNKLSTENKIILCKNLIIFKDLLLLRKIKDSVFFLNICNSFIKKNIKRKEIISKKKIDNKLFDVDIVTKLNNLTYVKFTNWIFD